MRSRIVMLCLLVLFSTMLLAQVKSTITDSYNAETAGNYTRALEIMRSLIANDAQDEFYNLRIGWLEYCLGNYTEALKYYQIANKIYPHLDAQTGILNCYLALAKWSDAKALADEILKNHPYNPTILSKAAYASYMRQDYQSTAEYYQTVVKIYPWDMEARGYLINNLYLSKDIVNAKKHYQKLKKYSPESPMVKEYAKLLGQ